ncbi:MAG: hypothetical protein DI538_23755 [Azospira oryzae]|nr:hypothetical protein [Cytophaga sp.]PZR29685.1 MAG: hypothetical protein DI538_23755 [Azospira oryzae]
MKTILKIVLLSLPVLFSACSEELKPNPPEYYRIFTGQNKKTWKITKLIWTGEGKTDVNYTSQIACYRDDSYVFHADKDNMYEVIGGSVKCSANEASALVSDKWSFVNATATLNIIMPLLSDNTLPFYVIKASSSEMTLEIYLDQDSQYSYQVTMQSVSTE